MKNTGTIVGVVLIIVLVALLLGGAGMTLAPRASAGVGFGGFGMMGGYGGQGGMMGGYNGYGGMMSGYGFNPLGTIISLVVWALIIGGIVWLVVWLARNANASTGTQRSGLSNESPLDVSKLRYARGEITKEQFDEMKQVLGV